MGVELRVAIGKQPQQHIQSVQKTEIPKKIKMGEEQKSIDWAAINEKLPYQRNDEQKAKRKEIFNSFDVNSNGYLSLAEVDKGMRDVMGSDELFDCKDAVNASFHYAKKMSTGEDKHGAEFLELREFRLFLQTLRQYFEYFQAFSRIDTGDDSRVSKEEFCSDATKEAMNKFIKDPIEDYEAEFDKIDENKGGQILFKEFIQFALDKNLDIDDDIDEAPVEEAPKEEEPAAEAEEAPAAAEEAPAASEEAPAAAEEEKKEEEAKEEEAKEEEAKEEAKEEPAAAAE